MYKSTIMFTQICLTNQQILEQGYEGLEQIFLWSRCCHRKNPKHPSLLRERKKFMCTITVDVLDRL